MATVTMSIEEYEALIAQLMESNPLMAAGFQRTFPQPPQMLVKEGVTSGSKPKRKVSAYHKRLGREIKRLMNAHKTKAGKWKKGWSQKRLMKTAHKNTK